LTSCRFIPAHNEHRAVLLTLGENMLTLQRHLLGDILTHAGQVPVTAVA